MAPVGRYSTDGAVNVTVVDGTLRTGRNAPDGSMYVVSASNTAVVKGVNHSCGAMFVKLDNTGPNSAYASDGSLNVTTTPFAGKGAMKVNIISGALP